MIELRDFANEKEPGTLVYRVSVNKEDKNKLEVFEEVRVDTRILGFMFRVLGWTTLIHPACLLFTLFTINPHARQHDPQPTSCIAPTQYASQKAAEDHLAGAPFKSLASKGKDWFSAPPVISFSEELGQGAGSRL